MLCHRGDAAPLGLRLDGFEGLMAGSERGPVVAPGDPDTSELMRRLEGRSLPRMPLTGPPFLDDAQIALVREWIAAGARNDTAEPEAAPPAEEAPTFGIPSGFSPDEWKAKMARVAAGEEAGVCESCES